MGIAMLRWSRLQFGKKVTAPPPCARQFGGVALWRWTQWPLIVEQHHDSTSPMGVKVVGSCESMYITDAAKFMHMRELL